MTERDEFRIGPFLSPPALSGSKFGSQQTAAGVSWFGILRPEDWALGLLSDLPVSLAVGGRYYLTSSDDGASGFGARAQITFILPRFA